jgi:hypothetical protein
LGETSWVKFQENVRTYNYDYFLVDDIYPRWETFLKPVRKSSGKKKLQFHNAQVAVKKYVERAFAYKPKLRL